MRLFFAAFLITILPLVCFPQDTNGTVITLSDRLGPVIDPRERADFQLFMGVKDFRSASLVLRPDSSLAFKVSEGNPDGSEKCIWFKTTPEEIERIRRYLEPRIPTGGGPEDHNPPMMDKPKPVSFGRQIGSGMASGLMISLVTGFIGGIIANREYHEFGSTIQGAVVGLVIGAGLGAPIGVCWAGSSSSRKGSAAGAIVGGLSAAVADLYLFKFQEGRSGAAASLLLIYSVPAFLSTLGYWIFPSGDDVDDSLLSYSNARWRISRPGFHFLFDPEARRTGAWCSLAEIRF